MDRPICGHLDCGVCVPRVRRFLRAPRAGRADLPGAVVPTTTALEHHARKFGPEGVAEVAAEHGLTVDLSGATTVERRVKRGARRGSLPRQVAELLDRGTSVDGIAEALDLSPSRARRLVNEALAKAAASA